ncbi:MAG: Methyl-CpG-binding domain protein 4 [Alectoria fallacina]|uniref:Methyl-CpG-binding domain protein 4 n=1 Tax=Alectoria fallacina TaxID=1903189 RepID=A0A8H3PK58_9LECA|nr:MAG: Methyl-CpG-binding domain protein 4 [Alectoria fallacina]
MDRYPTPADLAAANHEDVVEIFQHLGLQNQRAKNCINLAKAWLERPPEKGKRYRVLHYPKRDDGKNVRLDEVINDEDNRVAWEIGQLPGIGVYAIDSWRIFCRDELRGLPTGLSNDLTLEVKDEELQKEWTTVLPGDKELRAYLRWRWLRIGWEWDPVTGERCKADAVELAKATRGGVIYEGEGGDVLIGEVKDENKCCQS